MIYIITFYKYIFPSKSSLVDTYTVTTINLSDLIIISRSSVNSDILDVIVLHDRRVVRIVSHLMREGRELVPNVKQIYY